MNALTRAVEASKDWQAKVDEMNRSIEEFRTALRDATTGGTEDVWAVVEATGLDPRTIRAFLR